MAKRKPKTDEPQVTNFDPIGQDTPQASNAEPSEKSFEATILDLRNKLTAAEALIAAQDDLIRAYHLRTSRVKPMERVTDARSAWEALHGE